jgi:hypothetical protein
MTGEALKKACLAQGIDFVDNAFPPAEYYSLKSGIELPLMWRRSRQLGAKLIGRLRPGCVTRTSLGAEWLTNALNVLVEKPQLLQRCFPRPAAAERAASGPANQKATGGLQEVRLCIAGEWRTIVLDDLVPCFPTTGSATAAAAAAGVGIPVPTPLFCSSRDGDPTWVLLLEKAMAKVMGGYAALLAATTTSSTIHAAVSDSNDTTMEEQTLGQLTGLPVTALPFGVDAAVQEQLWRRLMHCWQHEQLVYLTSTSRSSTGTSTPCTVLFMYEGVDNLLLVKLRLPTPIAPRGNAGVGAWAKGSDQWTPLIAAAVSRALAQWSQRRFSSASAQQQQQQQQQQYPPPPLHEAGTCWVAWAEVMASTTPPLTQQQEKVVPARSFERATVVHTQHSYARPWQELRACSWFCDRLAHGTAVGAGSNELAGGQSTAGTMFSQCFVLGMAAQGQVHVTLHCTLASLASGVSNGYECGRTVGLVLMRVRGAACCECAASSLVSLPAAAAPLAVIHRCAVLDTVLLEGCYMLVPIVMPTPASQSLQPSHHSTSNDRQGDSVVSEQTVPHALLPPHSYIAASAKMSTATAASAVSSPLHGLLGRHESGPATEPPSLAIPPLIARREAARVTLAPAVVNALRETHRRLVSSTSKRGGDGYRARGAQARGIIGGVHTGDTSGTNRPGLGVEELVLLLLQEEGLSGLRKDRSAAAAAAAGKGGEVEQVTPQAISTAGKAELDWLFEAFGTAIFDSSRAASGGDTTTKVLTEDGFVDVYRCIYLAAGEQGPAFVWRDLQRWGYDTLPLESRATASSASSLAHGRVGVPERAMATVVSVHSETNPGKSLTNSADDPSWPCFCSAASRSRRNADICSV